MSDPTLVEPTTTAGQALLPILDAAETAALSGGLPIDVMNITQPARHAILAIEAEARAAAFAEVRREVERLPATFSQHTCWDNHEGGVDSSGKATLHADGSACTDRVIREAVSRPAVLTILDDRLEAKP